MPLRAIDYFRANVTYCRNLVALAVSLNARTTAALDLSDILRACLVMIVSALDHYIHERVRSDMLDIFNGKRPTTPSFEAFSIPLSAIQVAISNPSNCDWLDNEIRKRNGYRSFQEADRIAEAIRLVSSVRLWEEVGMEMGLDPAQVKRQLNLIVDRRNKIAHEADMQPTGVGDRWPIDDVIVTEAVDFVIRVVEAIELRT